MLSLLTSMRYEFDMPLFKNKKPIAILAIALVTLLLASCGGATSSGSPAGDPLAERPAEATEAANGLGRQVFERTCAECHGANGQGYANKLKAPALDSSEHAWHHPDGQIQRLIRDGGRVMPALGDQLSPEKIKAVVEYLHTLWTPPQLESQQASSKFDPVK